MRRRVTNTSGTGQAHQERRDAHELQLRALNVLDLEEAVDQVDGKVQGLRHAPELLVTLDL